MLSEFDELNEKAGSHIFSVSELNQLARDLLEQTLSYIWVEGEISNCVKPVSGHLYFTLKDANAQIRCAMFKGKNLRLNFAAKNGLQVRLYAYPSIYAERGDFQLIVEQMEVAGAGDLQQQFEMLKKKLFTEGLFDEQYKKPIPVPRRIGVITSATGAAIHDVLTVLKRRAPYIPIIVYPSQVQGEGAASQLIYAIEAANRRAECEVLLLVRGGGAAEDLAVFNHEQLARAIFASKIPIISGIGHEIDFTIADFVADKRAPTPSAAAELGSPDSEEFNSKLIRMANQLYSIISHQLAAREHQLEILQKTLHYRHPERQLREKIQYVDRLSIKLQQLMNQRLERYQHQLHRLGSVLHAVSPLATLQRGYAIVTDEDSHVIQNSHQVVFNQKLNIKLNQGQLICRVEEIK